MCGKDYHKQKILLRILNYVHVTRIRIDKYWLFNETPYGSEFS